MRITDSQALFRPTCRLVMYCVLIGLPGALAALAFDLLVNWAQKLLLGEIGHYPSPEITATEMRISVPREVPRLRLPVATTLGGLLGGWRVYRWAPEAEGHGTDAAIAAYHRRGGEVRGRIPFIKAVAYALTIGSGGVAGREAPTAQIAVGLGTSLACWAGLRGQERRSLLLAFMVQRSLTAGSRYPTLYHSQVPTREDSPLRRGVFVRRTLELLDKDGVETSQFRLPRLVNLLRFGESIPIAVSEGQLVAVIVGKGSEPADRTVVETHGKLEGVTAVAVLREGDLVVPRGDTRFQEGDQLLAVTALAVDRDLSRLAMARRSDDEPEDSPDLASEGPIDLDSGREKQR